MAAINVGELEATLRLKDELTSQLRAAQQQLASTGASLNAVGTSTATAATGMRGLDDSVKKAGAAHKDFNDTLRLSLGIVPGVTDVIRIHIGAIKSLAEVYGLVKIAEFAYGFAQQAASIRNLSQQTGIGVENLQILASALKDSGVNSQELGLQIYQLSRRIAGDDTSADAAFRRMGVSMQSLKSLSPEEIFIATMHAINAETDSLKKAQDAADLFGSRLGQVLLAVGPDLDKLIEKAKNSGEILGKDDVEGAAKFSAAIGHLIDRLNLLGGTALGPALNGVTKLIDYMRSGAVLGDLEKLADQFGRVFKTTGQDFVQKGITGIQTVPSIPAPRGAPSANVELPVAPVAQLTAAEAAAAANAKTMANVLSGLRAEMVPLNAEQEKFLAGLARLGPEFLTTSNIINTGITPQQLANYKDRAAAIQGVNAAMSDAAKITTQAMLVDQASTASLRNEAAERIATIDAEHTAKAVAISDELASEVKKNADLRAEDIRYEAARQLAIAEAGLKERDVMAKIHDETLRVANDQYKKDAEARAAAEKTINEEIVKGYESTRSAQKDYADFTARITLSSRDLQIRAIHETARIEKESFVGSVEQRRQYNALIDKFAREQVEALKIDWDAITANSKASLQDQADRAQATYQYMLAHADQFTSGAIADAKRIAKEFDIALHHPMTQWARDLSDLANSLTQLAQVSGDSFGGVVKDIANVVVSLNLATESVRKYREATTASGKITALIGGAVAVAQATSQGSTASRIAGGALAGAEVGSAFGPIGAGIGAAVGGLTGLLRGIIGVSQAVKDARGQQDQFIASLKQMGYSGATDFDVLAAGATKALASVGLNGEAARRVLEALMDTDHPERFKKALAEVSEAVTKLNAAVQHYGLTWKDLADPAAKMAGFKTEFGLLLDDFGRLSRAGYSTDSILKAMGPDFTKSLKDAKASGVLDGFIGDLVHAGRITQELGDKLKGIAGTVDYEELTQRAANYGITLEQLGPKFEQASISKSAETILKDFTDLRGAGGEVNGIMIGMSDEVNTLLQNAKKFGSSIPTAMKPMLQTFLDAGLLVDDQGKKLKDLSGISFADTPLEKGLHDLAEAINALIVALGGVPAKLDDIANTPVPSITIPVNFDVPSFPNLEIPEQPQVYHPDEFAATGGVVAATGVQHFAAGGKVLRFPYMPRGTDTVPAMLTPGEVVLTKPQQRAITNRLDQPTPMQAPVVYQVQLLLDGRVVGEVSLDHTLNQVARNKTKGDLLVQVISQRLKGAA